ncbi:39S ribosomal protein L38 mitochondrial [Taenia crassiceps]|uniref:Large ribosomal subunit protein mL38 n=1 Tax=Taenia crassiceps TaxID=6207 RepID=A0ABR4Q879_9CEST
MTRHVHNQDWFGDPAGTDYAGDRCVLNVTKTELGFEPQKLLKRYYWHRMGYKPRNVEPGSFPFPRRQVPFDGQKSYADRIECSKVNHSIDPINIGFKVDLPKRTRKAGRRLDLELMARRRQLEVVADEVLNQDEDCESPFRRLLAATHYGIFKDLFGPYYYFVPVLDVPIFYPLVDSSDVVPVYYGNQISAGNAMAEPLIDFSRLPKNSLWTLTMTSPDEPLLDQNGINHAEYIHWMISNIDPEICQDKVLMEGDLIVDYLPPLPYFGSGFHRYVFLLYRQDNGHIELSKELRGPIKKNYHEERVFSTADFYRLHQDALTPSGLAFFQSSWDEHVRSYFREHLPDISEPIFEIHSPTEMPPPQARFPLANSWFHSRRHPWGLPLANSRLGVHEDVSFDCYLDRYRDKREMDQELVQQRLATEGNPLDPDQPRSQSPYPLVSPHLPSDRDVPSWWKQQEIQRRLRKGRWAQLEGHED